MDYSGEQEQELEVLESIYPDELEVFSRKYPGVKFKVDVKLEPQLEDVSALTTEHTVCLQFTLPENYPDEAPVIGIEMEEARLGDDDEDDEDDDQEQAFDDHGNKVVRKLQSLPDQIHFDDYVDELSVSLQEQIENDMLLGMQMCFALISSAKELCETWFVDQLNELERKHELELQEREREEQKKFQGTKVTRESFLQWRSNFRAELGIDQRDAKRRQEAHHGRMTGRTIFERGLAGDDDETEESLEGSVTDKLRKL